MTTEPKDMAAVRRIIRAWRYPLRMTVERYVVWAMENGIERLNSRDRASPTATGLFVGKTPPEGRD